MTTLKLKRVEESEPADHFHGMLGRSAPMRELFATLLKIAPTDLTCLIEGETGTGKERVARAIHAASERADGPYIVLDCSSIPSNLVESYLFGHEKGAFTGAQMLRKGVFEQAQGGTLLLDEIGELELNLQPRLLRVLENCEFKRVGGSRTIRSDCRIVAASNRGLRAMVDAGHFREDLYFRLSIIRLHLWPLRKRREDIDLLVKHFLAEWRANTLGSEPIRLSREARESLHKHDWPGNIRELKNMISRAASLRERGVIEAHELGLSADIAGARGRGAGRRASTTPFSSGCSPETRNLPVDLSLDYKRARAELLIRFERAYLERVFKQNAGNISKSARAAGISRYYMRQLLAKHGLKMSEKS